MKLLIRWAFLIGIIGLIAACSTSKSLTSKVKVAKDDTFNYAVTHSTDMSISILGQEMGSAGKQETDYAFKITEVMPSGSFKSNVSIKRIALNQTIPMADDIVYDSANPNKSSNVALKSLGDMVGKTFVLTYDKEGQITKTEGIDLIVDDLAKGLDGGVGQQIVNRVGVDGLTNTLKKLSGIIQGKPSVGSSWNTTTTSKGIVDLEMNQTFTIKEKKDGKIIIDVTGTAKTVEMTEGIEFQGMELWYDLSGPVKGKIVVEEATGWAISSDITPDLKGVVTIKGGPIGEFDARAGMKIGTSAVRKGR